MEEKKITATLRIPTKQMYAYIEVVVEGTAKEVVQQYLSITDTYLRAQKQWEKDAPPF